MSRKTSLVSTNSKYDRIGVFHGGGVSLFNRWRSEEVSCMIDNRPYFSAWQRALIHSPNCAAMQVLRKACRAGLSEAWR